MHRTQVVNGMNYALTLHIADAVGVVHKVDVVVNNAPFSKDLSKSQKWTLESVSTVVSAWGRF